MTNEIKSNPVPATNILNIPPSEPEIKAKPLRSPPSFPKLVKLRAPFIIAATRINASIGFQSSIGNPVYNFFTVSAVGPAKTAGSVAKIDVNNPIFLRIKFLVRFSIKRLLG